MNANAKIAKKFCKVCKDLGKSEAEYTSHYVRDSKDLNSKVTCPNVICSYCKEHGHFKGKCPVLQDKNKRQRKEENRQAYQKSLNKRQ